MLAWEADQVSVTASKECLSEYQHLEKRMKKLFCNNCGEVLNNTNARGWKLVSQILYLKCNDQQLPQALKSNAHFFYDRRIVDIEDSLPKKG